MTDARGDRNVITLPVDVSSCEDCAGVVHDALAGTPGIVNVTVDANRNEVHIEVDVDAYMLGDVRRRLADAMPSGLGRHFPHAPRATSATRVGAPSAMDTDDHAHGHDHGDAGHAHGVLAGHGRRENRRRLLTVLTIASVLLVAEVIGGWLANSLVLLSDAAHVFTDVLAVALSAVAITLAGRPATSRHTFGSHRWEIVAAFLNALALWVIGFYLVYEAWTRLADPPAVDGPIVLLVGLGGLAVNIGMAYILHAGARQNVNMRSAYIHVMADALGSVAAIAAGIGILWFDLHILDPVLTLVIAALVLVWTWKLTRETLHILLEGSPAHVDADRLRRDILAVDGVADVHDLHLWSLTSGVDSMSIHVVIGAAVDGMAVSHAVRGCASDGYGIAHVTVQVENLDSTCPGCHYEAK